MFKYNFSVEDVSVEAVFNKLGGVEGARRFLRGDLELTEVAPGTIFVDRSQRPTYPDWMKEVLHPEFEKSGPEKFETASLKLWLHESQKEGVVKGQVIYDHLKSASELASCINLQDLLAIQAKGVKHFRKHFQGKVVFAWKSVVRYEDGNLRVPALYEDGGRVVLFWFWLGGDWRSSRPALRFA